MAEEEFLVPLDNYLKAGLHIGTKFKTKYMAPFIYKVRPDGLSVLNVQEINNRIKIAAEFMGRYEPEEILVACRRENGWKAANLFSKLTGIKVITGRYSPGLLINPASKDFTETKLLFVTDPWPDRNIVRDANKMGIPIIALCDTNNTANDVDFIIPCNNKGKKSLGLLFYILTKEYVKLKKLGKLKATLEDFDDES
ncbi:MAG: 30S ribosomal protein S2 [Nanoarchaeota archaeon]|nr:30S ribosomal protein S2 [Nanoarchaeota archaeon]|tara:strand:+ start:27 stop:617 length:591 start_codon:yes stop_codon:yes gene_type:complete